MMQTPIWAASALLLVLLPSLPLTSRQGGQEGPPRTTKRAKSAAPVATGLAGLLVYSKHEGKRWILLGHDRRGFWEILGGHTELRQSLAKGIRKETPLETAAREGFEESRMLLPYQETLRKARLLGAHKGLTIYTLEVDYIPRERFREAPIPVDWKSYDEMDDYAWVELSAMMAEIQRQERASQVSLLDIDGKRKIQGLRPALFRPLKKLTKLWGLLLGTTPPPTKHK